MDFWKTMGVLLRRWYVSVPIFVVCLGLAGGVFVASPTQYESTGTIVLTAPVSGGVTQLNPQNATGPGNPLLDFEGSLTITTQLLIESLSSPTVQAQIAAQGGTGTFQAGDGETGGPFVVIIADANSKALAERTVTLALNFASNELNQRQKALQAPASTFINTQVVVAATPATTKLSSKLKTSGAALAVGLILSLATAFAVESRSINRRRRKAEQDVDEPDEPMVDDDQESDDVEDRAARTHKMVPAPPPRPIQPKPQQPQPVRSGAPIGPGPRPVPPRPTGNQPAGVRREPFPPAAPGHQPHPAKPRVQPAPVPNTNNGHGVPAKNVPVNNGSNANNTNNANNGQNGKGNHRDWPPRGDFRPTDPSAS